MLITYKVIPRIIKKILIFILIINCFKSLASTSSEKEEKSFDAVNFLFEHIKDSHEWHILTWKNKHIVIPLPIILYSKNNGLVVFMSSKLHEMHDGYVLNNYKYSLKEGKIIEKSENGDEYVPLDLSITKNIVALFFSVAILLLVFLSVAKTYKRDPLKPPKGLQSFLEPLILFVRNDIARPSIGEKYEKYMPYLLTVFFFIWFNNILGLVPFPPGGANLTGNIAVTGVLALFTFIITNVSGSKTYWKHIFNTPGVPVWLKIPPLMPIIELFGIFTKPIVLMIRLFANITAGHLISLGFLSLIFVFAQKSLAMGIIISPLSIVFLLFIMMLELLVAFIQAFIFTFLSALYIGMAIEEEHH